MATTHRRNKPIRIDKDALDRWKVAAGLPLDDGAAANAAVRLAATWRELEAEAHAGGAYFLLNLLRDGHLTPADLADMTITVRGTDMHVGVAGVTRAVYGVNPGNVGALLRAAGD